MLDKPIFKALVTDLIPSLPWGDYDTTNPHISRYLVESGKKEGDSCRILWDECSRLEELDCENLIINCENPSDTDWNVRRLTWLGYTLNKVGMDRVSKLLWGCKVLSKTQPPSYPVISVIIPVKDDMFRLVSCLESVISQSYLYKEIIVVDDSSTDNSVAIAKLTLGRSDCVFHVIGSKGVGASAARNTGWDYATGDYVVFFDSDDVMPWDYLTKALQSIGDSDFTFPMSWWSVPEQNWNELELYLVSSASSDLHHTQSIKGVVGRTSHSTLFSNSGKLSDQEYSSNIIISAMWRRKLGIRFDESLPRFQDWDIYLEALRNKLTYKNFNCPPFIRNRVGSISTTVTSDVRSRVFDKHYGMTRRLAIVPFNSSNQLETSLIGPKLRGVQYQPYIPNSTILPMQQLGTLPSTASVYFVGPPTPESLGWVRYLLSKGHTIGFDLCVSYWTSDYIFSPPHSSEQYTRVLNLLTSMPVSFTLCSQGLKELFDTTFNVAGIVLPDWYPPTLEGKFDYSSTKLLCWSGHYGNIPSLLYYSKELCEVCEKYGYTVKIISEQMPLRLPFPFMWVPWDESTENSEIVKCDIFLNCNPPYASYSRKGRGKLCRALQLGMPIWNPSESFPDLTVTPLDKLGIDNLNWVNKFTTLKDNVDTLKEILKL